MNLKNKGRGGKLCRTESVTVRIAPKIKYGIELAAKRQRRTVSSYIEHTIAKSFEEVEIEIFEGPNKDSYKTTISKALDIVWDIDEEKRFIKLVEICPNLLTYDEEVRWERMRLSETGVDKVGTE